MYKKNLNYKEIKPKIFSEERLYSYGLWLLARKEYSVHEMKTKMKKYQSDLEMISRVVDKFIQNNYINDERISQNVLNLYIKKESSYKVKRRLSNKGIDKDTIDDIIEKSINDEDEIEFAFKQLIKKFKSYDKELKQKYSAYLAGRGYSWDIVSKALIQFKNLLNE